jgi:hypothetical protein
MAPFLVNHPDLLNNWIAARETAIARVRALPLAPWPSAMTSPPRSPWRRRRGWAGAATTPCNRRHGTGCAATSFASAITWQAGALDGARPWDALIRWSEEALSLEGQEICAALILEPHGDLVDDLAETMGADELTASASTGACRCRS